MTVKYLSETRGEAQRDSTTFQEAAYKFEDHTELGFVRGASKLLHSSASRSATDLDVLLPIGVYASGTYTIPGGRTWDDYELVILLGNIANNANDTSCIGMITNTQMLLVGPYTFTCSAVDDAAETCRLTGVGATQFTISRSGNNTAGGVIAYRKPGVA